MPYLIATAAIAGITYTAMKVAVAVSPAYSNVGQIIQASFG